MATSPEVANIAVKENTALNSAVAKSFRHLIPVLFVCYVLAYLDRINFGFAAITMNADLGVSVTQFGLAGTIFYVTYFLFEIPSNLLMVRFGARRWIARIMISWGVASMITAAATGPAGLYIARGLLGLAEAGFVPGVMLYLTYWIPAAHRGRATALFMTAQPIAIAIGSPLSGLIMQHTDGLHGLYGWQWLFILEATPTVLFGVAILYLLSDKPQTAPWMTPAEADAITRELEREPVAGGHRAGAPAWRSFVSAPFIFASLAYLALVASLSTLSTWSPLILREVFDGDAVTLGLVAALPGVMAVIAMPLLSASSDKHMERGWHFAAAATVAALGWFATTLSGSPVLQVLGLIGATAGGFAAMPILWSMPPTMLAGPVRPVGIAILSSAGILGSVISPVLNGFLKESTGTFVATGWLGVAWMLGGAVLIVLADQIQRRGKPAR